MDLAFPYNFKRALRGPTGSLRGLSSCLGPALWEAPTQSNTKQQRDTPKPGGHPSSAPVPLCWPSLTDRSTRANECECGELISGNRLRHLKGAFFPDKAEARSLFLTFSILVSDFQGTHQWTLFARTQSLE